MAERLDVALAARGLARSRTHAATLIADGLVTVDGKPVVRASAKVGEEQVLVVAGADHYVSRGAHKLIAALDAFEVPVEGRVALDAGASTGGFSQVLLERGARLVIAVDVGHGQLAPELGREDRLFSYEGVNVRELTRESFGALVGSELRPDLVVADLSFISLAHVLPALREVAAPDADFVLLVKPQFEVGRTGVREGIVRDAGLRADAVDGVLWSAWDAGLGTAGVIASPIAGSHGNQEALVHLTERGSNPTDWLEKVRAVTA
ncbi:TlyA family RNA methyltransferase [Leifsonia shinshuensis]|uniref:23S rRNA (Cytidine1920-2'-O)/16S rRNA (Cytidine1409-2'-O)-methyltransferase n=1 Tax=Leifsonia shinshuensis TaxID=150026 RepID=A0A853D081_9MICO|nr:TlyA family RNA methyltransferase [Leifsonia shinshuensis]NYJ24941.1 23S rRNA (cytidine1920-2'-O)/16S rRNA (cytidine1409-2'-O)-methyltransferase [Leifsonia shinshuensis]